MNVAEIGLTPQTASSVASAKLAENFDTFLNLLTAQLQNQDPLSPMESSEFVSQLVQFSEVEQAISANKSLETLIDLQTTNQATSALGYIGNFVETAGKFAPLKDDKAEFTYALEEGAASTRLVVQDEIGNVVFSTSGETTTGKHNFSWNGIDSAGNTAPEGTYQLSATANDNDGALVTLATTAFGRVTGIDSDASGTLLTLGSVKVPIGNVLSIKEQNTPTS
ncbi:MAG: flagellar basal-body rod modification protein FlgD [Alphaproteobacteria bacterium]|jgi:flagellar basal-body rod modification protein FlgD